MISGKKQLQQKRNAEMSSSGTDMSGGDEPDIVKASRENNYEEVDDILLRSPELINAQSPDTKMTALHWASANRNLRITQRLYEQPEPKVDPWLKDVFDRKAVDIAVSTANQSILDLHHRAMFPENFREFDEFDENSNIRPLKPENDPFS